MADAQAELVREIETRLNEAIARFGIAGRVTVEQDQATLTGPGSVVSTNLGSLPAQWAEMPPEARQRACTDIARRLAAARRPAVPVAPPSRAAPYGLVAALTVLGLMVAAYLLWPGPGSSDAPVIRKSGASPSAVGSAEDPDQARAERAARVCAATSERVSRGTTVGPTDTEGWVIELGLLRADDGTDLSAHPGLGAFVARTRGQASGRFVWDGAPELSALQGPDTRVEVVDSNLVRPGGRAYRGVLLTFRGRYVEPYFEPEQRGAYLRVAHAVAARLGATHAALFARCAGGSHHQLGAWFLGSTAPEAAATLVYFMGVFATPPHVGTSPGDAGVEADRARTFQRIVEQTQGLDRTRLAPLVGANDGMVSGPKDGPAVISFPFRDGNRATRVSHQIARLVGL